MYCAVCSVRRPLQTAPPAHPAPAPSQQVLLMPTIRCYKFLVALIYAAILFTCGLLLW